MTETLSQMQTYRPLLLPLMHDPVLFTLGGPAEMPPPPGSPPVIFPQDSSQGFLSLRHKKQEAFCSPFSS